MKKQPTEALEVREKNGDLTAPNDVSVTDLIRAAIGSGLGPDGIAKLVELQERIQDRQAEREFAQALLAFQNECPVIHKNKTAEVVSKRTGGKFSYDFASLDYLAATIRPHLDRHGISYSFDCAIADGIMTVKTILRHVGGHREVTSFSAPIDKEALMNESQKVASASSYARRYGLMLALGIATGGEDDDGRKAGTKLLTDDQVATLQALIQETGANQSRFLQFMGVEQIASISIKDYQKAVRSLEAKRARS